jgi:dehydrogenase/reductase SDR family member 7B
MKDKVVIVTGGSSGIGRALAQEFGSHGCKVLITGRNRMQVETTVSELRSSGIRIEGFVGDVSVEQDDIDMARTAIDKFGTIDVLINNAGISMRALFEEVDLAVIRNVMDINFYGALYATKYCLPEIIKNKGSIVGISSVAGYRGLPGRSGYSASKFALNGFLEVIRTEFLKRDVHVLTACPGFTSSNIRKKALTRDGSQQGESPRKEEEMMSAEECARHIYSATVNRKRQIILTSQGRLAILINKWFPALADKLVYNAMAKEKNAPMR